VKQYSLLDNVLTTIAFVFYSMPSFLIALGLIFLFAVSFRQWGLPYLPIAGMYAPSEPNTFENLVRHMILPITSMVVVSAAGYMRYVRASMLETLESDYVRTARAKGVHPRRIVLLHAFKNASIPLITLIGLDLGFILSGTVIIEEIFVWPGMGRLFIDSLNRSDYSVLMGIVMLTAFTVIFFQIVTDLAYAAVDPRIKLA
jgi:peptide/nickel transport system permease protein